MELRKQYTLLLGIILLTLAFGSFFSELLFGILGLNILLGLLYLISGVFGIWIGTKGTGKNYTRSIGFIALILGIFGFIPVSKEILISTLNTNSGTSIFHLILGIISLLITYLSKNQEQVQSNPTLEQTPQK